MVKTQQSQVGVSKKRLDATANATTAESTHAPHHTSGLPLKRREMPAGQASWAMALTARSESTANARRRNMVSG